MNPVTKLLFGAVLVLDAFVAVAAWWVLPHRFSPLDPHFWTNDVLPFLVLLVAGASLHPRAQGATIWALTGFWGGAFLGAWWMYPISAHVFAWQLLGPITAHLGVAIYHTRAPNGPTGALTGLLFGSGLMIGLRGPNPTTLPLNEPAPAVVGLGNPPLEPDGSLTMACGALSVHIDPNLRFVSRSPDRFWTLFGDTNAHTEWPRIPTASDSTHLQFQPDGDGQTTVEIEQTPTTTTLTSWTSLPKPIWSHLSSFSALTVSGAAHPRLAIADTEPIDVTTSDYPVGRPSRQASFDGQFLVVSEATSGEKGPFHELARQAVSRTDAVTLTLYDGDQPQCRVTLHDWLAQASIAPSPTAGWGFPQNALSFARTDSETTMWIYVGLANTSVGRGWDSVAHAAGTYRNRITISPIETP